MKVASPQDPIRIGQIEIRYLLEGSDTGGALVVFEALIPPNARVPAPHHHVTYDETVYELAGTCTFTVQGREVSLAPGQTLFIPRGAVHGFVNRGPEPVRFVATVTPGVLRSDFFREIGALVNAGGPPDLVRMTEVMRRHGLEPAVAGGAPLAATRG